MKTAAIIGATGLTGSFLVEKLSSDPDFDLVKIAVRRTVSIQHPKIKTFKIDFTDSDSLEQVIIGSDVVFCTIGTTRKKVNGDLEAYRKVDFDIPVNAAKLCEKNKIPQFILVSSIGADSNSRNFYLKLKGEVEDAIKDMAIPSISIFRPSMLLGKRQESRAGERIGQTIMKHLSVLIPSRYKPIKAEVLANAMIQASGINSKGLKIYFYQDMKTY